MSGAGWWLPFPGAGLLVILMTMIMAAGRLREWLWSLEDREECRLVSCCICALNDCGPAPRGAGSGATFVGGLETPRNPVLRSPATDRQPQYTVLTQTWVGIWP